MMSKKDKSKESEYVEGFEPGWMKESFEEAKKEAAKKYKSCPFCGNNKNCTHK